LNPLPENFPRLPAWNPIKTHSFVQNPATILLQNLRISLIF
jgi:hypothetical protein